MAPGCHARRAEGEGGAGAVRAGRPLEGARRRGIGPAWPALPVAVASGRCPSGPWRARQERRARRLPGRRRGGRRYLFHPGQRLGVGDELLQIARRQLAHQRQGAVHQLIGIERAGVLVHLLLRLAHLPVGAQAGPDLAQPVQHRHVRISVAARLRGDGVGIFAGGARVGEIRRQLGQRPARGLGIRHGRRGAGVGRSGIVRPFGGGVGRAGRGDARRIRLQQLRQSLVQPGAGGAGVGGRAPGQRLDEVETDRIEPVVAALAPGLQDGGRGVGGRGVGRGIRAGRQRQAQAAITGHARPPCRWTAWEGA